MIRKTLAPFYKYISSIIIGCLLLIVILISVLTVANSKYPASYHDGKFGYASPKLQIMEKLGIHFWDGGREVEVNENIYNEYLAMELETGYSPFMSDVEKSEYEIFNGNKNVYRFRLNTYHQVGAQYIHLSDAEYIALQEYQDRTGIQVIYPQIDPKRYDSSVGSHNTINIAIKDSNNANFWYKTKIEQGNRTVADLDSNGNFIPEYMKYTGNDEYTSKLRIEGSNNYEYNYAIFRQTSWIVRVSYYDYYVYLHTEVLKDGITEPSFMLGTNTYGQDILSCVISGLKTTFKPILISLCVILLLGSIAVVVLSFFRKVPIIYKYILPNAIRLIIISMILVIPMVIGFEFMRNYTAIHSSNGSNITELGNLLARVIPYKKTYPYMYNSVLIIILTLIFSFTTYGIILIVNSLRETLIPGSKRIKI